MNLGIAYAFFASLLFASGYIIDQILLQKNAPIQVLFIYQTSRALFMLPLLFFSFGVEPSAIKASFLKQWPLFLGSTIFFIFASYFILHSISLIGSARATILELSIPFFVVVLSVLIFKQGLTIWTLTGGGFMSIGAFLIIKG